MNKQQQIVVWSAIGLIVVMFLLPPMTEIVVHAGSGKVIQWRFVGWNHIGTLGTSARDGSMWRSTQIDFSRLALQIIPVVLIAAGLFYQFRERRIN